jgi:hypothetical protein
MYCDGRSIALAQPALDVAAQLQASDNSSCCCCVYNIPSSLKSHVVSRVILYFISPMPSPYTQCTVHPLHAPPPPTVSGYFPLKRSWWYLVSFNLIMIPLAMQKEEMQIADKTEWGGGGPGTVHLHYIYIIQYILQYSRELFTETKWESRELGPACKLELGDDGVLYTCTTYQQLKLTEARS